MPKLVIHYQETRQEHPLGAEAVTCGRGHTTVLRLADQQASREHCRFECENGKWYVIDLESSNGTQVDGRRIAEREELRNGCVIRIGETRISYVDESASAPPDQAAQAGMLLRVKGGPRDGETFRITKAVTLIGRHADNDIRLQEHSVSNHHAELVIEGNTARIIDKKSRNGVRVNNVHVTERALDNGDQIAIGSAVLEFEAGAPWAAAAAEGPGTAAVQGAAGTEPKGSHLAKWMAAFSPRVRLLMKLVGAVLAAALLLKLALYVIEVLLTPPTRESTVAVYQDNLFKENPSFEQGDATSLPGWMRTRGTASVEGDTPDGELALRLFSAATAGADVSAVCWSNEIELSPGKAYELSALIKNTGGASACLCVAWRNKDITWLQPVQLGVRTDDAMKWRQVSETLAPPSWASSARFGCALIGQGSAKFDGFYLREAAKPPRPYAMSAGRIRLEAAPRGEWTVHADNRPLLGRGRLVVTAGGRLNNQSLATLEKSSPTVEPKMIRCVGQLGLDGKLPFVEVASTDGEEITVHYDLNLAGAPGPVVALEFLSDRTTGADGVMLTTSRGASTLEKAPFQTKTDVAAITFFTAPKRIFFKLGVPASLTVTGGEADEPLTWRLEFPPASQGGKAALSLTWSTEKGELVAADLQRAIKAEDSGELGKAIRLYQEFMGKYYLYRAETAQADDHLKKLKADIDRRMNRIGELAAAARQSGADGDLAAVENAFTAAENAIESLMEQLKGDERCERLGKQLAVVKAEHKVATEKSKAREAAQMLAEAKSRIQRKEVNIARAVLEALIKKYPGIPQAAEAKRLLESLPPAE